MSFSIPRTSYPVPAKNAADSEPTRPPAPVMIAVAICGRKGNHAGRAPALPTAAHSLRDSGVLAGGRIRRTNPDGHCVDGRATHVGTRRGGCDDLATRHRVAAGRAVPNLHDRCQWRSGDIRRDTGAISLDGRDALSPARLASPAATRRGAYLR